MGVDVDEKEIKMAVLNGLPDLFDGLISALDTLGKEEELFILEFFKSRLLQEEQCMNNRIQRTLVKNEGAALMATRLDGTPYNKLWDHCKKPGQSSVNFWTKLPHLIPDQEWRRQKNVEQKNVVFCSKTS